MRSVLRPSLTLPHGARTRGPAHAWCARPSLHAILLCGLLCGCSSDREDARAFPVPFAGSSAAGGGTGPSQLGGGGGAPASPQPAGTGGSSGTSAAPQQSGSGGAGGTGGTGGAPASAIPNGSASFTRIYDTLFMSCRSEVCHGGSLDIPGVGLDMQGRDSAYMAIVGATAAATGPCASSGLMRVVPFEPERSLLFLKYSGNPPCGEEMPPAVTNSKEDVELLRAWIAEGALNN